MINDWTNWTLSSAMSSALDSINPALTRYGRKEPAPVLPLREEPDLLSWLEASGRLVEDEESSSSEVSTVEEEELSALMPWPMAAPAKATIRSVSMWRSPPSLPT